jgi:hypothetical protein
MGQRHQLGFIAAFICLLPFAAHAQQSATVSKCLAVADTNPNIAPRIILASAVSLPLAQVQTKAPEVSFSFIDHAVWQISSPNGVTAVTDYYGLPITPVPDIATMNNAHRTHWTPNPDPAIKHVLRGWSLDGIIPAKHAVVEGDIFMRNVATDIRSGDEMRRNGNSIFIFETADLCIGHLGHLHTSLTDSQYAQIGRLDVIMVPVDGRNTMSQPAMSELMQRLRPSVILPMHLRGNSIQNFISLLGDGFETEYLSGNSLTVSLKNLPKVPTVFVPVGLN